jgi:hypothetical protein
MEPTTTQQSMIQKWRDLSHPLILLSHMIFKIVTVVFYILGGWFYLIIFLLCGVLAAVDFWIVKNISGRLLVRLLWWNETNPHTQKNEWRFEYDPDRSTIHKIEDQLFWNTMYVSCTIWIVLSFFNLIQFKMEWLLLTSFIMGLNLTNLVAYWQCYRSLTSEQGSVWTQWASKFMVTDMINKAQLFFASITTSQSG